MSAWTIGWLLWGGWFAIEEGWALKTVGTRGTLLRSRRFALAAVMAWLSLHFLTGGAF